MRTEQTTTAGDCCCGPVDCYCSGICGPVPTLYTFTLEGVTNGGCFNCAVRNRTVNLVYDPADGHPNCWSRCLWGEVDIYDFCLDGIGERWYLTNMDFNGHDGWHLFTTQFCTTNPPGGGYYADYHLYDEFTPLASMTFSLADPFGCLNMPATITIEPGEGRTTPCPDCSSDSDSFQEQQLMMTPPPSAEARTYLVNLKRRRDRLTRAMDEMNRAGISPIVYEAADGSRLPLPQGWPAGSGAYGCALSHRGILTQCVVDGVDVVTVFEDDVILVDDYRRKLADFMKEVPKNWDAVFLGGQHIEPPVKVSDNVLKCTNCHRTHAYILRGDYIRKLLKFWTDEMGHIDHVWGRHQKDFNVYAPANWLCGQGESKSDINGRQLGERFWKPRKVITPKPPAPKPLKLGSGCGCGHRRNLKPLGPNRRFRK